MSPRPKTLAVFGGSFNPPHLGHALLPSYLLARGDADRVLVAPCSDHPLGKALAPFERRLSWVRLALAHCDARVEVSAIEAELAAGRDGRPSYTLELLEVLAERHPDERVRLVVGSDILESGETERWHGWDAIMANFDPIVVPRAGWSVEGAAALPEISSTAVRAQLELLRGGPDDARAAARGRLQGMIPGAVAAALERWIDGSEPRVWVFGHGHVARHACPWLIDRGFAVAQLSARDQLGAEPAALPEQAPRGVWLLCRDGDLGGLARALRGRLPPGVPVLHAAGARLAREALAALREAGHPVGTLHPICALRRERPHSRLATSSFGISGDPEARAFAAELVGHAPILDIHHLDARGRLAYHAACALVANHLAVLEDRAGSVLRAQGLTPRQIDGALGELMIGSAENLVSLGIPAGVTGPLARGDRATVDAHLGALDDPSVRALYQTLSAQLEALLAG